MLFEQPMAIPRGEQVVRRFGAKPGINVDRRTMRANWRKAIADLRRGTSKRRLRRLARRPVAVLHAVSASSPRPRARRAAPYGRDGNDARDDGGGGDDGDSDGPPAPSPAHDVAGGVS